MPVTTRAVSCVWRTLIALTVIVMITSIHLSSNPALDETVDSHLPALPAAGWREAHDVGVIQPDAGAEFGLSWGSESIWLFSDADDAAAVVRLNNGHLIAGDIIMEYLIRTSEGDREAASEIYGQATYCGSGPAVFWILESSCKVPSSSSCSPIFPEPEEVKWTDLRSLLGTSASRTIYYVFDTSTESIAFGPIGRLGFSVTLKKAPEIGVTVLPVVDIDPISPEARHQEDSGSEVEMLSPVSDQQPVGDQEQAGLSGDAITDVAVIPDLTTPENTAAYFLEAVMVDRDPDKASRAWSPRVPSSVVYSVIANEIELFAGRSIDVLRFVLSSLSYSTEQVSDNEVVVSVVDNSEDAVLGRLELRDGEWLFIALGYQLDQSLDLSQEWQRVISAE